MGRWSIIVGKLQLLMLIALTVDMAHISSRSITHQRRSDDKYYDADRDSYFDLCRGKKCLPHQICTETIYGHEGPYICGDRCPEPCILPMYCNTDTQDCNPCSNICSYSDEDSLRQCRKHCYDIYKKIIASDIQTSTAPFTATDSGSITSPMCHQDEYYDADSNMCLEMCGEFKCQIHQICSTKVGGYTGPLFCVSGCVPMCVLPLYCNKETARCDSCLDICNDQNEETLRLCRIYCYDVYKEMVVSRTNTAAPPVSTSSEFPPTSDESVFSDLVTKLTPRSPTSDESVFSDLVTKPTPLSPGEVAVLVVICGVLLSVVTLYIRSQQRTGETSLTEDAEIELMEVTQPLMEETVLTEDAMPRTSSIVELDQYMTKLKESYSQQIHERNEIEKKQYGKVIHLDQHEPVIINHALKEPDRQKRRTYEFVNETSDSKPLTLKNFLRDNGQGRPRSVLMLSGPGMGKTSICYTILDWFVKCQWKDHEYIFFIPLKGLVSMASSVSLADILFDYSKVKYNSENKETLIEQVKEKQNKTLIILDGYDECDEFITGPLDILEPMTNAGAVLKKLVCGSILSNAQVLLTSRAFNFTNENLIVDKVVQLAGLTANSVLTLLENDVIIKMDKRYIVSLLSIPINLQKFLSYRRWVNSEFDSKPWNFPRTKTSLYSVQMIPVLRQTLRLINSKLKTELEMWDIDSVLNFLRCLARLASIAFDKPGNKQIMFQSHELEQCGIEENSVKHGGLMTSFKNPTPDGMSHVVYYYFIHLTNLEWLGGLHIVDTTLDQIRGLIRRNKGQLDVILCFAVGLLGDKDGQVILKRVYGMSSDDCRNKAYLILNEIIQSNRCTCHMGGHQYALEVYHEGQFTRPHLLLPLLAIDGNKLVMTDIALYNRDSAHYFLSQLIDVQNGQMEDVETATKIAGIYTMLLHFTRGADSTVQDIIVREVSKLEKLKYLSIQTDGGFRAAVKHQLDLLTVHGRFDRYETANIIQKSSASAVCLFSSRLYKSSLVSSSVSLRPFVKEFHLGFMLSSSYDLAIECIQPLRAVTGLWYDHQNAHKTLRLIENNPELQAVGLGLETYDDADSSELTRVLMSSPNIQSIALCFRDSKESHFDLIFAILREMTSLREIWLTFQWTMPDDNQLTNLAEKVCALDALNSVSLVGGLGDINISTFLKVLSENNRCLSTVYTDQHVQLDRDLVERATGRLVNVKNEFESMFYSPLVNSQYLLTSVPSHIKDALRKRYVSLQT